MTPRKQEKVFEKKYAHDLLTIAKEEYATAEALLGIDNIRIEHVFYLAQQVIEKALKGVLVSSETPVPMIHDLAALVAKMPENLSPPYGYEMGELTMYATIRRYEVSSLKPTTEELQVVLSKTKEILAWAQNVIEN